MEKKPTKNKVDNTYLRKKGETIINTMTRGK